MKRTKKNDNTMTRAQGRAQTQYLDLAYRLVRCIEPEEQTRLKDEVVRSVRKRGRTPSAGVGVD